jgi:hypothetical protein
MDVYHRPSLAASVAGGSLLLDRFQAWWITFTLFTLS